MTTITQLKRNYQLAKARCECSKTMDAFINAFKAKIRLDTYLYQLRLYGFNTDKLL